MVERTLWKERMSNLHKAYIFNWHLTGTSKETIGVDIPKYKKLMRAREYSKEAIDLAVSTLDKKKTLGFDTHLIITTDGQLFSCSPFKQYLTADFDSMELGWTGDRDEDRYE